MSGIVFLGTRKMDAIRHFYVGRAGMEVWLEQADCMILKHGNLLLGFCERDKADIDGILTIFYDGREQVDDMYERLKDVATTECEAVPRYGIYRFFVLDPEGRKVEFQWFAHPVPPSRDGEQALVSRRSIRKFLDMEVPDRILNRIFETCRYAPTSKNSQPYYFVVIRDTQKLQILSNTRGQSTAPIARAPLAIAICTDPGLSNRYVDDGIIAAYHLMLSAWNHGLGTCYIAAMDRDDVKETIGVPREHYVATVTPVGYPYKVPRAPTRREASELVGPIDKG
jgi:nitroreductase